MNTPIMKAYQIFYFAPKAMKIDDVYIAESSVDAIKKFVIANKGKCNVFCALVIVEHYRSLLIVSVMEIYINE